MKRLLRASLLVSGLSLLLFFGGPTISANAQERPPEPACVAAGTCTCEVKVDARTGAQTWDCRQFGTNKIIQHQSSFQAWTTECKQLAKDQNRGSCIVTKRTTTPIVDTVKTECRSEILNFAGDWNCEYTSDDGSKVIHNPSSFNDGSKDTNIDSNNVPRGYLLVNGNGEVTSDTGSLTGAAPVDSNEAGKCSMGNLPQCFLNIPGWFVSAIAYAILVLSTWILFVAGTVFNWVVIRTVFQFALYFGTSAGMLTAWGVLRDIANIALLFGFIFVGIATILNTPNVEGYSAKKALPRLIIFAVLLNFSLFATQGVIDIANGFASIFSNYAGQGCEEATANGTSGQTGEECANVGISGKITAAAGMNHFPTAEGFMGGFDRPYSTAAMLIMLSILVSITAVVLLAASIMLVIRVVVLSLLMVTSPIGFAGMAIPSLKKIADDWWKQLINQAFFAPLYLLMVFVSLKLVDGLQEGDASVPDAISANVANGGSIAGNMQVLVVYAIVIGFMVGSLMIAQKMGAAGASFATKTAGGMVFGAQGFVARRTVGRLSAMSAQRLAKSDWAEKHPGMARLAYAGLNKGATSSFSARGVMGSAMKGVGAKGVDFGKVGATASHGYHKIEEKAEDERLKFAKELKDRPETDAEYSARMKRLQPKSEANAKRLSDADAAIVRAQDEKVRAEAATPLAQEEKTRAEAALVQATAERKTAEEHLAARKLALEEQKLFYAQNPTDPAALDGVRAEEANVARANDELRAADEGLARANTALATANTSIANAGAGIAEAEKKIAAATKERTAADKEREAIAKESAGGKKEIKAKERQIAYANNMNQENTKGWMVMPNVLTAGGHGNHAAAAKILKDANKTETERALDVFKKKLEAADKAEAKEAAGHDDHADDGHGNDNHAPADDHGAPAAHGGGH